MEDFHAFTLKSSRILNMLPTSTIVSSDVRNNNMPFKLKQWRGLWDTGASKSSITQRIVDDLNLIPVGNTNVSTANGIITANTYYVGLTLLNRVTVKTVLVSCADLGDDIDVLIGMDIIRHGDFAITNTNGSTTFSFRTPSIEEFDYEKDSDELNKNSN